MSLIKRAACKAIAAAISAEIAELDGKTKHSHSDEEDVAQYPSLAVIPGRTEFVPYQEDEITVEVDTAAEPDYDADAVEQPLLATVGDFEARVQLKLYCDSQIKRERLESKIMNLFLSTELAPGNLVVQTEPITLDDGLVTLNRAVVSCFLDDEEWQEEMVFAKKRSSTLTLAVNFPALISRNVNTIKTLVLAIAMDLEATEPEEQFELTEDGTLAPYTDP